MVLNTKSKPAIPILSPLQVKKAYLKEDKTLSDLLKGDLSFFSMVRIEELFTYIKVPNKPFKNTSHGFIFVKAGTIRMQLDVLEYVLGENTFILTPAGQANCFKEISNDVKGFMGTFNDHFFDHSPGLHGVDRFSALLNPGHLPHFVLDRPLADLFTLICERVHKLYLNPADRINLIQSYWMSLMTELDLVFKNEKQSQTNRGFKTVLEFKSLLLRHIRNNPKPADLAEMLHVSVNHLNKVLKKNTQFSTSEWIAKRQVIEAQLMLKHSDLSVTQVAHHLGFDDPSYFSKFFFRHTRVTPSQYKKD